MHKCIGCKGASGSLRGIGRIRRRFLYLFAFFGLAVALSIIFIATVTVALHKRFYDVDVPDWLGIFKGPAFVVIMGFLTMLPLALLFCAVWPAIQHGIGDFQGFLKESGAVGVWLYTFSERILLPAGLHHFIYLPFIFGPAMVDGGIQAYWSGLHLYLPRAGGQLAGPGGGRVGLSPAPHQRFTAILFTALLDVW